MTSFESFVVEGGVVTDIDALVTKLIAIIEVHDVLRLKGFAAVEGKAMRLVVQAVGKRVDAYFDRDWNAGEGTEVAPCGDWPPRFGRG